MKRPKTITDEELEYVRERTLSGDSLSMIARDLKKSAKTICRCRAYLDIEGVGNSEMTEDEKEQIIRLARKGWTKAKISAAVQRSHSSVLKVCKAAGIESIRNYGGKNDSARLRALSFLSLGYSMKKVAKIVSVEEELVRQWSKEDLDAKLPAKRIAKRVNLNWIRVEDDDGTETWQCRATMRQVSLTMREAKTWLLLDPWREGTFKSREEALIAAKEALKLTCSEPK